MEQDNLTLQTEENLQNTAKEQTDFATNMTEEERIQSADWLYKKQRRKSFWGGTLLGGCVTLLLGCIVILALFGTKKIQVVSPYEAQNNVMTEAVTAKLNNLITQIGLYYYEDAEAEDLINGLYKGLFEGLGDPYSEYYTKEEYEEVMITATANYYGIGAALSQDKNTMVVTVSHVYDDSGAQRAGLKKGDIIVTVDGIEATSEELSDLVTKIRGEEGSTVEITILREEEEMVFNVERGEVVIPTVEYRMLEGNVGLIQVAEFATATPAAFQEAIEDLQNQGMQAMIVDLRSNGGGMLTACQKMLDMILPEGTVVYTEDKYGNREDFTSDAEHFLDIPMVVLVNENSASASEIFAGAIRDFDYGKLIGTNTFGKGIVQNVKQLSDGSAYKLTVSRYFTPCGDNIHGVGIAPDIELEFEYLGDEEGEYDPMMDNQVLRALEELGQ